MSTNLPRTVPEFLNWCSVHTSLFTTNATAVGLSAAQASAFSTLVTNLNKANIDAQTAREASKLATETFNNNWDATRGTAAAYIAMIKAYAETTHNPNVYILGGVSPPDPAGTVPAPVAPREFSAKVNTNGSLTIEWKVSQPAGVTGVQYSVLRRLNGSTGEYTIISSGSSKKSFTDTTLPFGVDRVEYVVQPTRNDVAGPQSNAFIVQFGTVMGGGNGMSITGMESTPSVMKMAA